MSTTFGPPVPVDGPPPIPRPFSILSVATPIDENEKAAMGVTLEPYPPELPRGFDPCSAGTFRDKAVGSAIDLATFPGFTAYVPITCTRMGVGSDQRFQGRAMKALEARDAYIIERQLISASVLTLSPHVGDSGVSVISNSGIRADIALNRLEEAIAATGQMGVIGVTPGVAAQLGNNYLRVVGGQLQTINGTPVFAGAGLLGLKPDAESVPAAGKQWAWAMGPLRYWRGPVYVPGDRAANLDRQQNNQTYYAERELVVGWDKQLQAAVLVDSAA